MQPIYTGTDLLEILAAIERIEYKVDMCLDILGLSADEEPGDDLSDDEQREMDALS